MSELILSPPDPGENRQVSTEGVSSLNFDFPTDEVLLDLSGSDLVIEFDNGGQIVLAGILEQSPEELPELQIPDGTVLSLGELLNNMRHDPEPGPISPEAGPAFFGASPADDELQRLYAALQLNADKL